jgi:acyl-CoA synthetase (AMP-forming)/AMP-acid ligase II
MFELIARHERDAPAIVDAATARVTTYGALRAAVEAVAAALRERGGHELYFLGCANTAAAIATYLGCLHADRPVCLLEASRWAEAQRIVEAYQRPTLLLPPEAPLPDGYRAAGVLATGYHVAARAAPPDQDVSLHPELSLLLTTSGSTGDPKLVRLKLSNVRANAESIAQYLELGPRERCIQSLPVYYSYGLSLVNSHLVAGGTIVLTPHSFFRPDFWKHFAEQRCTSFAGVPHMYETLKRLRFDPARQPTLRSMTQAGGKLPEPFIEWFGKAARAAGCRFFVMYGQTEATARISYVPPERLLEKVGSIGIPIPRGKISLAPVEDAGDLRELVYEGPNVMMGYADSPAALGLGDELGGVLRTGDLARADAEGYFYIVGRLKRFAKLFGKRVNLMDIELALERRYPLRAAAVDSGRDQLILCLECHGEVLEEELVMETAGHLAVPPACVRVRRVEALPMTRSGKKDYAAIARAEHAL